MGSKSFINDWFIDKLLWVHAGLSASSVAFFLALFSAGHPSTFGFTLKFVVVLMTISLCYNIAIVLILKFIDDDLDLARNICSDGRMICLSSFGLYSGFLSFAALIFYYSKVAGAIFITLTSCIILILRIIHKNSFKASQKKNQMRQEEIRYWNLENLKIQNRNNLLQQLEGGLKTAKPIIAYEGYGVFLPFFLKCKVNK